MAHLEFDRTSLGRDVLGMLECLGGRSQEVHTNFGAVGSIPIQNGQVSS